MIKMVFGLEKMNTLEEFMFWTACARKKMNTLHLFMIPIKISPHVPQPAVVKPFTIWGKDSLVGMAGWPVLSSKAFLQTSSRNFLLLLQLMISWLIPPIKK